LTRPFLHADKGNKVDIGGLVQEYAFIDHFDSLNSAVMQSSSLFPPSTAHYVISPVKDFMNAEAGRFLLYVSEPALIIGSRNLEWNGRLPPNLPGSFEAHLTAVRHCAIVQLQVLSSTGTLHILSSTLSLRIISHPLVPYMTLPKAVLKEFTGYSKVTRQKIPTSIAELKSSLADLKRESVLRKIDLEIRAQCRDLSDAAEVVRMMRERIEACSQFSKSVALRSEGSSEPFATIKVHRAHVMPGGKIIGHLKFATGHLVDRTRLSIETIEVVNESVFLNQTSDVHFISLVRMQEWPIYRVYFQHKSVRARSTIVSK